jgi:DNA-binding transcriptional MerR regulator
MENRYLIGQFAGILGMDADTIRYYEREGIIKSHRATNNNYRYYTDMDCRAILQCRALRSMGFSINEIRNQKCDIDDRRYVDFLEKREEELHREEIYLKQVRKALEIYREAALQIQGANTDVWVKEGDRTMYFFRQTEEAVLLSEGLPEGIAAKLMRLMPLTFQAGIYSKEMFLKDSWSEPLLQNEYYECGLMLEKEMVQNIPEAETLLSYADRTICWKQCCQMIVSGKYDSEEMRPDMLTPMLQYIQQGGYQICGDAVGQLLPTNISDEKWYILYYIPVEKISAE